MGPKTLAAHVKNFAKIARYCDGSSMEKRCDALVRELDGAKRTTSAQEHEGAELATLAVRRLEQKGSVASIGNLPAWWDS